MARSRKGGHGEHDNLDRWLLTYADLITLLLGLFVVLYSMAQINESKFHEVVIALGHLFGGKSTIQLNKDVPTTVIQESDKEDLDKSPLSEKQKEIAMQVNKAMGQYIKSGKVSIVRSPSGLTIHLLEALLFDIGKANLKPEAMNILDELIPIISNLPNDIRFEGHTDNVPINTGQFPSNWHLSVARGLNTAYYMIQKGVNPQKISIVGYSEYRPVAPNDSDANRALNRRVDIVIVDIPTNAVTKHPQAKAPDAKPD